MNIEKLLQESIVKAFKDNFEVELTPEQIALQPTKKEFEGTYTFVTFPFVKQSKKSPEDTGRILGEFIKSSTQIIADFNVVKGFLNFVISDKIWVNIFTGILSSTEYGSHPQKGQKVMVEYSSPNTNKPLHLGHLRNNFLGYSLSEILKMNGYEVIKANLVNDRGIHICKSMLAYSKWGNNETPESAGIKGDHLIGKYYVLFDKEYKKEIDTLKAQGTEEEAAKKQAPVIVEAQQMLKKWEDGDKEVNDLWRKMNGWVYQGFEETYKTIGVDFDKFYYESQTYLLGKDVVEEGLEKGVFYKRDDGSVWADLTQDGLDEKLVMRSDGTSVYITQDLGTADLKFKDFNLDRSIYVVGNEQDYHLNVLFLILKKLGRPYADGLYHLSYGMVDLPSGKMKSREGTVVDADELVNEMVQTACEHTTELGKIEGFAEEEAKELYRVLGLGALKYFLLKVDPKKRMMFNPQESIDFQGNTGPFIQYTYARISAILRRAKDLSIDLSNAAKVINIQPAEREVIYQLSLFPKKVEEAAETYSPSIIAQYVYDTAKEYNRFYAEVSIFNEQDTEALRFRVQLSQSVARTIKEGLRLLGIEAPERM
ncbi:MAG TPA: arginine--tRNA ligase [Cytophagales bacterium]|nr:arginine--tRNA ligase [Cytophagales bacterium]